MHLLSDSRSVSLNAILIENIPYHILKEAEANLYQCEADREAVVHVVFENAIPEDFHNWRASSGASSSVLYFGRELPSIVACGVESLWLNADLLSSEQQAEEMVPGNIPH